MSASSTAARNAAAAHFAATYDRLQLRTAGGAAVIATVTLPWGAPANGVVTADPPSVNASGSGVAAEARYFNAADPTIEVTGLTVTATGGGGQVELQNTNVASGQAVDFSTVAYTAPASLLNP